MTSRMNEEMNRKKVKVSIGLCDRCGAELKSELVSMTFKGFMVSRRLVPYCPNNDCIQTGD